MMHAPIDRASDTLLRLPDVIRRTKLSRTTIYRRIGRGEFPAPVKIGENSSAWYESEVGAWIANPMGWAQLAA